MPHGFFFIQRGQRQADGHALFLFKRQQPIDRFEFVGVISVFGEPLVHDDRDGLRAHGGFLRLRHGAARLHGDHGRARFFQDLIGHLAQRDFAAQRLRRGAHHDEIGVAGLFDDGLRRIGGDGRSGFDFRQALEDLLQSAKRRIGFAFLFGGQMERRNIDRVDAEPHAQGQFGMRAAAHGNQHVPNLIGQRAAHQGHITRRVRQHLGGRNVQRVEVARPFQQQQVRFVGGNGFHQVVPRLMRDMHLCFVAYLLAAAQRAQSAPHLPRFIGARAQRLIGRHINYAHQHDIGGQVTSRRSTPLSHSQPCKMGTQTVRT